MEVINKEQTKKSWNEVLAENIAKADKIAIQIKEKVLLPQFTLEKMAELMRLSRYEAQQRISHLAKYAYLEEKKQNGVTYYKIVSDPKDRIKNIEQTAAQLQASFKGQMDYFEAMQEITTNYIKEEALASEILKKDIDDKLLKQLETGENQFE